MSESPDLTAMRYVQICEDAHGGSHVADHAIELAMRVFAPPARPLLVSTG